MSIFHHGTLTTIIMEMASDLFPLIIYQSFYMFPLAKWFEALRLSDRLATSGQTCMKLYVCVYWAFKG